MAKKRKAPPQNRPVEVVPENSKLLINSYEDVADSEDEFHINRDKVLLDEGPEAKRRRKLVERDEFLQPSEDEVLGYSDDDDSDDDDVDVAPGAGGEEEVDMGSDYDFEKPQHPDDDDEEADEGWGPSKRDYYNADAIETEQDALDEEAEARRLQKKQLQSMTDADFGFDEADWTRADPDTNAAAEPVEPAADTDVVTEVLPQIQVTDDTGPDERLRLLRTRYPEFAPLAVEFVQLQGLHDELALAASAAASVQRHRSAANPERIARNGARPVAVIKHHALAAYLAAMAMYFALLTSTSSDDAAALAKPPAELRDHSVMEGLVRCRELWRKVERIPVPDIATDVPSVSPLDPIVEEPDATTLPTTNGDAQPHAQKPAEKARPRDTRQSKAAQRAAAAVHAIEAARAARLRATEASLAELSHLPVSKPSRKPSSATAQPHPLARTNNDDDDDDASDLGDEPAPTPAQAAEKAQKRRSLRFYTAQLAQTALRRGAAAQREAAGGDADIPRRERLIDRAARLTAAAERRGRGRKSEGEALGGSEGEDEEDVRVAREVRGEGEEYYEKVARVGREKKAGRRAEAVVREGEERDAKGVVRPEVVGADGKRAVGYVIEKNKGLAPKRSKDQRNPRVRKKKKFEEKKRKLASMKPVYKGGEARGGYGGELTGIKRGLVKAVKL